MIKNITYPIIVMLLAGCYPLSKTTDFNEPLINVYGKMMNRGFIEFYEKEGTDFKITTYSYYIEPKKNIVRIGGRRSELCKPNSKYVDFRPLMTTQVFKKREQNTWREKYYKMIDPDFLDMNNARKMQVVDSVSRNCRPIGLQIR